MDEAIGFFIVTGVVEQHVDSFNCSVYLSVIVGLDAGHS